MDNPPSVKAFHLNSAISCFIMFKYSYFVIFLFACNAGGSPDETLPLWFNQLFKKKGLDKQYIINAFNKPASIQADFNRDGTSDIAVLVAHKSNSKKGILLVHGKTMSHYLLGVGNSFGSGGDDFEWMDKWSLYTSEYASETLFDDETGDILGGKEVKLAGPGILVEANEDGAAVAGGVIYWDGKNYTWIHQGE